MKLGATALIAAAAATLATGAGAAPAPRVPAAGSSTTSTHPTFEWSVQPPEISASITIASSPQLASSGEFVTADLVDEDDLQPDQTSWTPTRPLTAGTYWWHVGSRDTTPGAAGGDLFAPVAKLTISTSVAVHSLKLQWSDRQFLATVSIKANVPRVHVVVQLFSGTHVLGSHRSTTHNFLIDPPTTDQSQFTIPAKIKRGAKLRLVTTLTVKGATARATLVKSLRAP